MIIQYFILTFLYVYSTNTENANSYLSFTDRLNLLLKKDKPVNSNEYQPNVSDNNLDYDKYVAEQDKKYDNEKVAKENDQLFDENKLKELFSKLPDFIEIFIYNPRKVSKPKNTSKKHLYKDKHNNNLTTDEDNDTKSYNSISDKLEQKDEEHDSNETSSSDYLCIFELATYLQKSNPNNEGLRKGKENNSEENQSQKQFLMFSDN